MKIATFNVNSVRIRLPIVLQWLEQHQPDVLCLQETKVQDDQFPLMAFASTGYHVAYRGMKSYNGVAVLSRKIPESVCYGFDDASPEPDDVRLMRVHAVPQWWVSSFITYGFLMSGIHYLRQLDFRNFSARYAATSTIG